MNSLNASARLFLLLGGFNALLAVALGAFGAHALKSRLEASLLKVFETANDYHFYHALGLLLVGVIAMLIPVNAWLKSAGWFMFAGILIFCGSLYCLSILNLRWLGMVTPVGGLALMVAWLCLCMAVIKS